MHTRRNARNKFFSVSKREISFWQQTAKEWSKSSNWSNSRLESISISELNHQIYSIQCLFTFQLQFEPIARKYCSSSNLFLQTIATFLFVCVCRFSRPYRLDRSWFYLLIGSSLFFYLNWNRIPCVSINPTCLNKRELDNLKWQYFVIRPYWWIIHFFLIFFPDYLPHLYITISAYSYLPTISVCLRITNLLRMPEKLDFFFS